MGVITTHVIYSARIQDEITQGVSVNRQEVQSLNSGDSTLGEEKGPARENEKEPTVELGGKKR